MLVFILPMSQNKKEKIKNKSEERILYDNVYYASAEENSGASESSSEYKGGTVYVGKGSRYTVKSGTIANCKNIYGGAIYVANGGICIISGGTIESCTAEYGGAIYVENGGSLTITGGTIKNNSAKTAPAIYLEDGAHFEMDNTSKIKDNYYIIGESGITISQDTIQVGGTDSTLYMHYINYGNYPQTYVGNTMNNSLESLLAANDDKLQIIEDKVYETRVDGLYGSWQAYTYQNEEYVRGYSKCHESGYTYKNGESVLNNEYAWFKVGPIKWLVLNYDKIRNGDERQLKVLSYLSLASYVRFNASASVRNAWKGSELQTWCNEKFYNQAFNIVEKKNIKLKHVKNNVSDDYGNADSDGKGETTQDYVHILSYYEECNSGGIFADDIQRQCSPTDFALSNNCSLNTGYITQYRIGTAYYWLRSAGSSSSYVCYINYSGALHVGNGVNGIAGGARCAMSLDL